MPGSCATFGSSSFPLHTETMLDAVVKDSKNQGVYFSLFTLPSPMTLYSSKVTLSFTDLQNGMASSSVNAACVALWLNSQSETVLATETIERCGKASRVLSVSC